MKEKLYPFGGAVFIPNATIVTDENSTVVSIHRVAEERATYDAHTKESNDDQTKSAE